MSFRRFRPNSWGYFFLGQNYLPFYLKLFQCYPKISFILGFLKWNFVILSWIILKLVSRYVLIYEKGNIQKGSLIRFFLIACRFCFQSHNQESTMAARLVTNLARGRKILAKSRDCIVMAWVSRITKDGGGLVYRNIRTHTAWKSFFGFLVKKEPVITRSGVLLYAIHGCYRVSQTSEVLGLVFVIRPLFVVPCCLVNDVNQHGSVRHVCDVAGWYLFVNRADIPVNLHGHCDLS